MNTINTLRQLIETGALGINPDTPVTLGFEYDEDVMHYNDDYQEDVFSNSDVASMLLDFLTTGVDSTCSMEQSLQQSRSQITLSVKVILLTLRVKNMVLMKHVRSSALLQTRMLMRMLTGRGYCADDVYPR